MFAALEAFADEYITCLLSLNADMDVGLNDLHMHMLFGALCSLAELQAVPSSRITGCDLRLVLDRRPFI
ncbi:MAG TPA: hypothetical protein VK970_01505 [Candidatus Methylacidiphilales bacterium]|nr:hypothetical protein [Candidatus Methylacidiphilales bacterium]